MIRVVMPHHLRTLTGAGKEVELQVTEPVRRLTDVLHRYQNALTDS